MLTNAMKEYQFATYQRIRTQDIAAVADYQKFHSSVVDSWTKGYLNNDQSLGLLREWRAYWYLVKRFPKWNVFISKTNIDIKGIDIIMFRMSGDLYKTVQVGGNMIDSKSLKTDYYVQVTDDKIYFRKGVKS